MNGDARHTPERVAQGRSGMYSHPMTTDTHKSAADLLPIGEAARLLGVSVGTVRRWEREGKISAQRTPGGQRRFDRAEIERARSAA